MKQNLERQAKIRFNRIEQLISSGASLCSSENESNLKHYPRFEKLISKLFKIEEYGVNEVDQLLDYFNLKIVHLKEAIELDFKKNNKNQNQFLNNRKDSYAVQNKGPINQGVMAIRQSAIDKEGGFDEKKIMLKKYEKMVLILEHIKTTKKMNMSLMSQINDFDLKEIKTNNDENVKATKKMFDKHLLNELEKLEKEYKNIKKNMTNNHSEIDKIQNFMKKCEEREDYIIKESRDRFYQFCKGNLEKLNGYDRILLKLENMYMSNRNFMSNKNQEAIPGDNLKPVALNFDKRNNLIRNSDRLLTNQK
jgi:hypothetical protein